MSTCLRMCVLFEQIQKYLKNTHAKTHSNYTVDIVQIFRVSRDGEDNRFKEVRLLFLLLWFSCEFVEFHQKLYLKTPKISGACNLGKAILELFAK